MDYVHVVTKSQTELSDFHFHFPPCPSHTVAFSFDKLLTMFLNVYMVVPLFFLHLTELYVPSESHFFPGSPFLL